MAQTTNKTYVATRTFADNLFRADIIARSVFALYVVESLNKVFKHLPLLS
jgi:hypothetical protein